MNKLKLFVVLISALCCNTAMAQQEENSARYVKSFAQNDTIRELDCYSFVGYWRNANSVYNLRGYSILDNKEPLLSMKVNPSGTTCAVLSSKKGKSVVSLYDLWEPNRRICRSNDNPDVNALCFTANAKTLIMADGNGLRYCNAHNMSCYDSLRVDFKVKDIEVSKNGYFVAATNGYELAVWNFETKNKRVSLVPDAMINAMGFSDDSKVFAVLTSDGKLSTYETKQFSLLRTYEGFGKALDFAFHPEDKYVSIVCDHNSIIILNLKDPDEVINVSNPGAGISKVMYARDNSKRAFMIYNTIGAVNYRLVNELKPNYTQMLEDELQKRMSEWMKMGPNETAEEYGNRVNEATRLAQMSLFEQEIATSMADNLVGMSSVNLGNYDMGSSLMEVGFSNMPSILLSVPSSEVNDFMNAADLEFRNAKYGIMANDKFELTYAEVYNKKTGKTYIYDNTQGHSMGTLVASDNFVPLELVQQSNIEEIKLQVLKEDVVNHAKLENVISDHTNINVKADVVSDYDADGKKITNYVIGFSYQVEDGYSVEDFGPGEYKASESGAATSMLSIVKKAFEGEFASYVRQGKKLKIRISGMADAIPVNRIIPYDGCYGEFHGEPVYKDNELSNVTVTRKGGIRENEQLAFLRALCVKDYIQNNVKGFSTMGAEYEYNVEVSKERGGEFRRIQVEFVFVDAFNK